MPEGDSASRLLSAIEAEQARLRTVLAGSDPASLAARPANGKWSVLENLRHLLFAHQLHFARLTSSVVEWDARGLPPHNMQEQKRLRMVGVETNTTVEDVFDAWQSHLAASRAHLVEDSEEVRRALDRHLRHLRAHAAVIERLVRAGERGSR
jgi:DNA-binding GntR family transcriptional regulator